jgi:hypothetical protein
VARLASELSSHFHLVHFRFLQPSALPPLCFVATVSALCFTMIQPYSIKRSLGLGRQITMERIRKLDDAAVREFRRQTRIRHASTPEAREMLEKTIYGTIGDLRYLGFVTFNTQKLWAQSHAPCAKCPCQAANIVYLEPCPRVSGERYLSRVISRWSP